MTDETYEPTKERLAKNRFDRPETDKKRDQRAYVSRDQVWELWRVGDIQQCEYEAARKLEKHFYGFFGHDVRTTDFANEKIDEEVMPQFQLHGLVLAKVRDILTQREMLGVELLILHDLPPSQIGLQISKYKTREQAKPYALSVLQSALERLSKLWGLA